MSAVQRFLEDAVKGGHTSNLVNSGSSTAITVTSFEEAYALFLNPSIWQAVGKVRGWDTKDFVSSKSGGGPSKMILKDKNYARMIGMMEALYSGQTIEEYLLKIERSENPIQEVTPILK